MKIKRLNLPSWVISDYKKHELFEPEDCLLGTYRYPKVELLLFNRNGWYCLGNTSWFEINGVTYLAGETYEKSAIMFKYCLEQLNYQPITDFEYQILKKLSVYGNFPELNKAIGRHGNYLHFRDIKIEGLRTRKRFNLYRKKMNA